MERSAIIVAGGSGSRMGAAVPKQFLLLKGRPILMHTLSAFSTTDPSIRIYLVLPQAERERWDSLCKQYQFEVPHQVVSGGRERTLSVINGLAAIPSTEGLVAIHDGVRPLVSHDIIERSFEVAGKYGNAVASVQLKDSIRKCENDRSHALDRSLYRLIQTPQTFSLSLIREAYAQLKEGDIKTDDAAVLEASGAKIHLIEGEYANLKITTREDMKVAEALMG